MFNSLPHDQHLNLSKFKVFADYKWNMVKRNTNCFLNGIKKNLCKKRKMLLSSISSFCHIVFKSRPLFRVVKAQDGLVKGFLIEFSYRKRPADRCVRWSRKQICMWRVTKFRTYRSAISLCHCDPISVFSSSLSFINNSLISIDGLHFC